MTLTQGWPWDPFDDDVLKNPPANAGTVRDVGSIPRSGRPLEEEMATNANILARIIPWTEEPGRLEPIQRIRHD